MNAAALNVWLAANGFATENSGGGCLVAIRRAVDVEDIGVYDFVVTDEDGCGLPDGDMVLIGTYAIEDGGFDGGRCGDVETYRTDEAVERIEALLAGREWER